VSDRLFEKEIRSNQGMRSAPWQGAGTGVKGAVGVPADHHERHNQSAEQKQLSRQVERDEIGDRADDRRRRADEDEERPRRQCFGGA